MAGQIEVLNQTKQVILKRDGQPELPLSPDEVSRFLKYNPKSGKIEIEARSLMTVEGKRQFFNTPKYTPKKHAIYDDLFGKQWYQKPDGKTLMAVPEQKEAYQQFFLSTPSYQEPVIGARRAMVKRKGIPHQLISYLNREGFRITPGAMQISVSFDSWSNAKLTEEFSFTGGSTTPIDEEVYGNNFGFRSSGKTNATAFRVKYGYYFPLSRTGKIDLRVSAGYSFQQTNGFQTEEFRRGTIEASSAGFAHLASAGFSLNYRAQFASFNGYCSLGAFIETPFKQKHLLYNFIRIQDDILSYSLAYQGAYTTITFPTLELGVEHPISRAFWVGLFVRSGLRYNLIESANTFFSLGTSINY